MDFFGCKSNACNPFAEANKNTDTVKCNPVLQREKENAVPNDYLFGSATTAASKYEMQTAAAEAAAAEQRRAKEEHAREAQAARERAEVAEMEAAAEAERVAAQREAENEERRRQEKERHRQEQEEQRREKERQREEEAERKRKEQERQRQEEAERQRQEAEQKARDGVKVKKFLADHGYAGVNLKRTKMMKSKYPLHTAVKLNDVEMIQLLLAAGADPKLVNSSSETPKQLARKLNKNDTHGAAWAALP